MDSNTITALATALLVLVGYVQVVILLSQRRQSQLSHIQEYHRLWSSNKNNWGVVIFIGRDEEEYYQIINTETLDRLTRNKQESNNHQPTIWAIDSSRAIFTLFSDACTKTLKGQIDIRDLYSIFGTEILRHSRPLRTLLDSDYNSFFYPSSHKHLSIRNEIQDWLIYHDGIRRRCLILIDLLWAEAARLEDLPPDDLKSAADAKIDSGKNCRKRLFKECIRLNGICKTIHAIILSRTLKNSEYKKPFSRIGIRKKRLETLEKEWTERLLRKQRK